MKNSKGTIVLIGNHHVVIYNFRKELVEKLLQDGYRVVVFLPLTQEAERIRELGCELVDVDVDRRGKNPLRDFSLFKQYWKNLKRIQPQIVLTYTIKPNIYGGLACRLLNIPYISTITGVGMGIQNGGILTALIFAMYRAAMKKVKKLYFQNEDDRNLFEKKKIGGNRYCMVKGSGVNLETFPYRPFPGESEPIRFIYVARIAKIKGIDTYLEVAEYIKRKYPQVEFHILGFWEEDYKERINRLAEEGIIIYHGMQKNVVPYLEKCQCLVHPSRNDGMSNACLEAAATGRAIIASDIPGCRECLADGVSGFLNVTNDTSGMIEKIEKFIALPYNERRHMGEMGRKKMEREFSRKDVVNAYREEIIKYTKGWEANYESV